MEAEDNVNDDDAPMSTDVTKRPIPPGHKAGVHTSDSQSLSESLTAALATALSAAAAYPERQVVQSPTPELMVAYFKKHLQRHMTASGVAGTEDLSLSAACRALEQHCPSCTLNAHGLVAKAMEELRLEAERGEEKSEEELAWILSYSTLSLCSTCMSIMSRPSGMRDSERECEAPAACACSSKGQRDFTHLTW